MTTFIKFAKFRMRLPDDVAIVAASYTSREGERVVRTKVWVGGIATPFVLDDVTPDEFQQRLDAGAPAAL